MLARAATESTRWQAEKSRQKSLLTCPKCKLELRLLGIETASTSRDLYTFECSKCGSLEVRGVKVK